VNASIIIIAAKGLLLLFCICMCVEARQRRRARKEAERQKFVAQVNRVVTDSLRREGGLQA
jgi:hypothetical protein